jgi:putative phosphoribosyl transferase
VGREVERVLCAPLELWFVARIFDKEDGDRCLGSVSESGGLCLNPEFAASEWTRIELPRAFAEVKRRAALAHHAHARRPLRGRNLIIVDDGMNMGWTMRAAVRGVTLLRPSSIVVAVPVAPEATVAVVAPEVDRLVCTIKTDSHAPVSARYLDYEEVPDAFIRELAGGEKKVEAPAEVPVGTHGLIPGYDRRIRFERAFSGTGAIERTSRQRS